MVVGDFFLLQRPRGLNLNLVFFSSNVSQNQYPCSFSQRKSGFQAAMSVQIVCKSVRVYLQSGEQEMQGRDTLEDLLLGRRVQ